MYTSFLCNYILKSLFIHFYLFTNTFSLNNFSDRSYKLSFYLYKFNARINELLFTFEKRFKNTMLFYLQKTLFSNDFLRKKREKNAKKTRKYSVILFTK